VHNGIETNQARLPQGLVQAVGLYSFKIG